MPDNALNKKMVGGGGTLCKYFVFFFLVALVINIAVITTDAQAGLYFGQVPTSNDIIQLVRDNDGNIIAIDSKLNVFKFDYFRWLQIKSGPTSQINANVKTYYDNNLQKVVLSWKYDGQRYAIYNVNNNNYEIVENGPFNFWNSPDHYVFLRNNEIYSLTNNGNDSNRGEALLYKYNNGSWNLVSSGPDNALYKPNGVSTGYYDKSVDQLIAALGDYPTGPVYRYKFADNSWQILGYGFEYQYNTFIIGNSVIVSGEFPGASYNRYQAKKPNDYNSIISSDVNRIYLHGNDGLYMMANGSHVYFWYSSQYGESYWDAGGSGLDAAMCVVYDKYGNIFVGGKSGRVAVRDQGGVWQNNTDFYTDYAINLDIKPGVNNAVTIATQARDAANTAKSSADTAASRVWDSTEGKSAATLAKEARDKANQALVAVNNLQNSITPVLLKVSGYNGATCTTGTAFNVVVQAPGATEFRVKADTGSWSSWVPVSGYATATGITGTGAHTIFVEVRNSAGAVASGQMTVFKL